MLIQANTNSKPAKVATELQNLSDSLFSEKFSFLYRQISSFPLSSHLFLVSSVVGKNEGEDPKDVSKNVFAPVAHLLNCFLLLLAKFELARITL